MFFRSLCFLLKDFLIGEWTNATLKGLKIKKAKNKRYTVEIKIYTRCAEGVLKGKLSGRMSIYAKVVAPGGCRPLDRCLPP